jgi:hypothetical protein
LFHRKDGAGRAFLDTSRMSRLHDAGVTRREHKSLASVLTSKTDTYGLFRWLDERFNGDLFPGKAADSPDALESAWREEKLAVKPEHLTLLAEFVRGDLEVSDGQLNLWPQYAFDTIPLEFISSIYEEFLTEEERGTDKAYYTPGFLVDYVLDAVLPWQSNEWNLRILDPCCGSGIFLVKAFQRLIHRWKLAHPGKSPLVRDLRPILEKNLVGIDKNPEAVRVACFSLYLAMADAIEPKHYVSRDGPKLFPRLRGTRLLHADFFDEAVAGIGTHTDAGSYDLVLGNAPWGDGSIKADPLEEQERKIYADTHFSIKPIKTTTTRAQIWARATDWPIGNNDIGPLFLPKAAALLRDTGRVAMINTASLLSWRDGKAVALRKKLFTTFSFEEITNLSAIRRDLFSDAIGPACVVVFGKKPPTESQTLGYFIPKPRRRGTRSKTRQVETFFLIEPSDAFTVSHHQAIADDPWVWSALAVGGTRHLAMIRRLKALPTLAKLEAEGIVDTRKGVINGDQKKKFPEHKDKPILADPAFPEGTFLKLNAARLSPWSNPVATSGDSTDFSAFKAPQLIVKLSYDADYGRIRAALVGDRKGIAEVICQQGYVSCHDRSEGAKHIQNACILFNSKLAVWFSALTSGRFPFYNSNITTREIIQLPLPEHPNSIDLSDIPDFETVDTIARELLALNEAEWALVEDFVEFTLPDFLRKTPGPARQPTSRLKSSEEDESDLRSFSETFIRVLEATFGKARSVRATIFTEGENRRLPVRVVTFTLGAEGGDEQVCLENISSDGLLDTLHEFHSRQLVACGRDGSRNTGIAFQRVGYLFHTGRDGTSVNLSIIKPDERRYWTRTMAMRDADELAASISRATISPVPSQ